MAAVPGRVKDPHRKFQFRMYTVGNRLPPESNIGFTDISGLRGETEAVVYREGTDAFERKVPGRTTYGTIKCSRGIDGNGSLKAWRSAVVEGSGFVEAIRDTLVIQLLGRDGAEVVREWRATEAWPMNYEMGDLSGTASDVLVESVEFAIETIEESKGGDAGAGAVRQFSVL